MDHHPGLLCLLLLPFLLFYVGGLFYTFYSAARGNHLIQSILRYNTLLFNTVEQKMYLLFSIISVVYVIINTIKKGRTTITIPVLYANRDCNIEGIEIF